MDPDPYPQASRPDDADPYGGLDDPTRYQAPTGPPRPPPAPEGQRYAQPPPQPGPPPQPPPTVYAPPAAGYDPAAPYPAYPSPPEPEANAKAPDETKLWVLRVAKGVVFFVYLVVAAALVLLAMAFALQAFGANPDAGFAEWVYRQSERLMEPFRGIFPTKQVSDTSVLDFSLLFAMVVYAIVALVLHALVSWLADRVAMADRDVKRQQYAQDVERRRQEDMRYRAQQAARQRPQPGY